MLCWQFPSDYLDTKAVFLQVSWLHLQSEAVPYKKFPATGRTSRWPEIAPRRKVGCSYGLCDKLGFEWCKPEAVTEGKRRVSPPSWQTQKGPHSGKAERDANESTGSVDSFPENVLQIYKSQWSLKSLITNTEFNNYQTKNPISWHNKRSHLRRPF